MTATAADPLVLLVHPALRERFRNDLVHAKSRVAEAADGEHAFDLAVTLVPDYIVLDLAIAGSLVQRLRECVTTAHIRIVGLAGPRMGAQGVAFRKSEGES